MTTADDRREQARGHGVAHAGQFGHQQHTSPQEFAPAATELEFSAKLEEQLWLARSNHNRARAQFLKAAAINFNAVVTLMVPDAKEVRVRRDDTTQDYAVHHLVRDDGTHIEREQLGEHAQQLNDLLFDFDRDSSDFLDLAGDYTDPDAPGEHVFAVGTHE